MINNKVMRKYFNKYVFLSVAVAMSPATLFAAEAGAGSNSLNSTLIWLLTLVIVLLFVIGMMGATLIQLGYAYRDKLRKERKGNSGAAKTLLLLIAAGTLSFGAHAQEAAEAAAPAVTSIGGLVPTEFYMLVGTIILELVSIMALIILLRVMIKALMAKPGEELAVEKKKRRIPFWDRFNNAVAIEKEEDIMLDHNYDGIKELDNSLPPWWKYGFYFTIIVAIVYIWYYHGGGNGPSSHEEYLAEMKRADEEVAAYLAKSANNVDENSVTMLGDVDIAQGRSIFETTCFPCHGKDGGGNTIGPNLTDKYWLHGGSIKDIFKSIKYGWTDKGMKSWKDDFSPKQLAQLASFVKSLQGTTPANPKAPQGELYIEAEDGAGDSDSTQQSTTAAANSTALN